jgi:hypothetical protein
MKAGVPVDDWKLPVFRKALTDAGYTYTDAGEITPGTTMLHVETASVVALALVLTEAEASANVRERSHEKG